jgi:hypothetical protein
MKSTKYITCCCAALLAATLVTPTYAQENEYTFELGFPSGDTARAATDATDMRRAIEAYKFFYPTVATEGVFQQFVPHGMAWNKVGIIMAQDPEQQFAYANQDTPYIMAFIDLTDGPIVVEVPAGPSYIGGMVDHNQEWFGDNGLIGPNKGKGGKGLLLPPGFKGELPLGYTPYYAKTWKAVVFLRFLSQTGSYEEALSGATKLKVYPLTESGYTPTFRIEDIDGKPAPSPLLTWEKNMEYWRMLHKVITEEPTQEKYRVMNGMLAQLGIEKGKPFAPDKRMQGILSKAAVTGFNEMNVSFFANPRDETIVWKGLQWEYVPSTGPLNISTKEFGNANSRNLLTSDAYFWSAYGTSASIGIRKVGAGSMYYTTPRDATGAYLDGGKNYKLTIPGPVPVSLFWSLTVYDSETRTIIDSGQGRGAVRSLFEKPQANADGSIDIYFGPNAPRGKEDQWVKTIPGKGWFTCVRLYGPQASVFDGSYKLPDIEKIK